MRMQRAIRARRNEPKLWSGEVLFEWVLARCEPQLVPGRTDVHQQMRPASTTDVAVRLGVTRKTAWMLRGRWLTDHQADSFTTLIGVHPSEVWPGWLEIAS